MDIFSPSDAGVFWNGAEIVTVRGRIKCLRLAPMDRWLRQTASAVNIRIRTSARQGLIFKEVDYWVTGTPERVDIFTHAIRHFIHILQDQRMEQNQ